MLGLRLPRAGLRRAVDAVLTSPSATTEGDVARRGATVDSSESPMRVAVGEDLFCPASPAAAHVDGCPLPVT